MNLHNLLLGRASLPALRAGIIHVWQVSTGPASGSTEKLRPIVSPEEWERAGRFHFEKDRRAFLFCRGLLRSLLSLYTGAPASRMEFAFGPQGKPSLKSPGTNSPGFNASHSGERVILAFAAGREVGVDVELKRLDVNFAALARSSFSALERSAVVALPPAEQADLFYEYWTCKEACIKADGRGLAVPLDRFLIAHLPGKPFWRTVEVDDPSVLAPSLRIRILSEKPGYAAAVAASGSDWDVAPINVSS